MDSFLQNASPQDQASFVAALEDMHLRDTQRMYNGLTLRCFDTCVNSFRTRKLDAKEVKCINTCCDKYASHMQRASQRFAEQNQAAQQQAAQQQQQQPPR
jgi:import inner membrane translocase subunit TIM9